MGRHSFLGGAEKIKQKLLAFAHTEFSGGEFINNKHIEEAIINGEDILKRNGVTFRYLPICYYPVALQKISKQYPALLYLNRSNIFRDMYYTARRVIKGNY